MVLLFALPPASRVALSAAHLKLALTLGFGASEAWSRAPREGL